MYYYTQTYNASPDMNIILYYNIIIEKIFLNQIIVLPRYAKSQNLIKSRNFYFIIFLYPICVILVYQMTYQVYVLSLIRWQRVKPNCGKSKNEYSITGWRYEVNQPAENINQDVYMYS